MKDAPLREGLILVAILLLLIIPLRSVTETKQKVANVKGEATPDAHLPVDVLVYGAQDWDWMELRRGQDVLGRVEGPAREGEFECPLSLEGEILVVAVKFSGENRTALGMEFWPQGHREQIKTFWGQGELIEEIQLHWHE